MWVQSVVAEAMVIVMRTEAMMMTVVAVMAVMVMTTPQGCPGYEA